MDRNISLDILKLLATFMVVGLHTRFFIDVNILYSYLMINGVFRIAVPIFLIINGFYFYAAIIQKNQKNWVRRVIVLYLVWMLFYAYFYISEINNSNHFLIKLSIIFFNGYYHLWYIANMIGAALLVLVIGRLKSVYLIFLVTITFATGVVIQYAGNYHILRETYLDELFNKTSFHRNFLLFSFPFFCIGFLINKHSLHDCISVKTASVMSIIGFCLVVLESYLNFTHPSQDGGFDNLASLIFISPFLFILFKNITLLGESKIISQFATAVYLVHISIMLIYERFANLHGSYLTMAVFITSTVAAMLLIKLDRRLKIIL